MFKFRKMKPEDKPRIVEMTKKIWEGHDYMPVVFDKWVKDDVGEFTAIEYDGKIIGCSKLTFLGEGEAWFEGLRKDPEFKVKGLGYAVNEYYMKKLAKIPNLKYIRFSTYIYNYASIKANEKFGFEKTQVLNIKEFLAENEDLSHYKKPSEVVVLQNDEKILDFINRSRYFEKTGGLCPVGWIVYPYSEKFMRDKYISQNKGFGIEVEGEIKGLIVLNKDVKEDTYLNILYYYAEDSEAGSKLLHFVKYYMRENNYNFTAVMMPDFPELIKVLEDNGFKSWETEDDFFVYEFPLEKLNSYK